MPRILAIDWDRHEVRGLLISSGATGTAVTGAWTASLATADPDGLSGKQIGGRLAAAVAGQVTGKVTTLVGVGRDNVQIKLMSLPPAPAAELPDLVRFQAEREFSALGPDSALDFIPISGDEKTPNQVLALALNPAGMAEASEVCQALNLEPDRLPVRGCAAAALVTRAAVIPANQVALIVNPFADEADLSVQADDKVILLRTVRLPDPSEAIARQRALLGEIRRTIAAVRQQLTDRQVDTVILCGNEASIVGSRNLTDELELPVTVIDPATQAPTGLSSKGVPPESLGRFAAVLGMALSEAERRAPIVDFAHVRKQLEARRFSSVHVLAAAAAVLGLLGLGAYLWMQLAEPARELAELQNKIHDVESQAETLKDVTARATATNRWLATDVNYLDELVQLARGVRPKPFLAKDFPVAKDAVMTDLRINRPTGLDAAGGRMSFQGVAKSQAAVPDLEDRLTDNRHRVTTGVGKQDKSIPGYDWGFGLDVRIARPEDQPSGAATP
jgi:Tfp pilus assembly PilM family ATPase